MVPKDLMQKRVRKFIGLQRDSSNVCVNSEDLRSPNPSRVAPLRGLRQPPSYLARSLPLKNPFEIPSNQLSFKIPNISTKGHNIKKVIPTTLPPIELKTICDLDPNFFSIIEGRAIKPNNDINIYMTNIRDIAMGSASIGYLRDSMLCIESNAATENELFGQSNWIYRASKLNFMKFLRDDYADATVAQNLAKEVKKALDTETEQLEVITFRFVELRSTLSAIRVECVHLARHRKYLNRMSPLWWREHHDEEYQRMFAGWSGHTVPSVFFPHFEDPGSGVDEFQEEVEMVLDPKLYFQKPEELLGFFAFLENQSLNYLENSMQMFEIMKKVLSLRDTFRSQYDAETRDLNELIGIYEEEVVAAEDRAAELQGLFEELLNGTVRQLVSAREVLQLEMSIEWAHEQLFQETLGRGEMQQMATRIQAQYLELAGALDAIEGTAVRAAEREYFAAEARGARQAQVARTQLVQWANMNRALHTAFDPPRRMSPDEQVQKKAVT